MTTLTDIPTQRAHRDEDISSPSSLLPIPQYSRRSILLIWAAAALPMAALAWVVAPWLATSLGGPQSLVRALVLSMTAGLVWQGVLTIGLVWREQRNLRWTTLRDVLWLRAPRSPRTGRTGGRTWLVVIPLIVLLAAEELIPQLPHGTARDLGPFLESDAGQQFMHGAWGWFAVIMVMAVFNTVLGEELLFRGFLLPRMHGAFGDRDWLANGALFSAYHLHVPWVIPGSLVGLASMAYPSKRYRSALIGIAVHSAQTVFFAVALLTVVL